MMSVADALDCVLSATTGRSSEQVGLGEAGGRALAEDVVADLDLPPFANSQMDGFAVRAADLAGCSASRPIRLRVLGTVAAGSANLPVVEPGGAVRIMTGAPIPPGADAVVKVEDTVADPAGTVVIQVAPAVGEFVRPAGEDIERGQGALAAGRNLRPADIGFLAALGRASVRVASRPRVAVLATGDELVLPGRPLGPGQIYNSNAFALAAAVRVAGAEPVVLGGVRDDRPALEAALREALAFDVILTTGGVSVGDFDYVKDVMADLGIQRRFWRVAQKPGKPLVFAVGAGGQLLFGLPGNPVSTLVCFELYVAPALRRALGLRTPFPKVATVTMSETLRTARDLTELVRCRMVSEGQGLRALPTGTQSSGALRSMVLADALVVSPPGTSEIVAGSKARALLLDGSLSEEHPFREG